MAKTIFQTEQAGARRLLQRYASRSCLLPSVVVCLSLAGCNGTLGGTGDAGGTRPNESGDGDQDDPGVPPDFVDENGFKVFPQPAFDLEGSPLYSRVVPLTNPQWARTVQTILKLPEPAPQANSFLKPVSSVTTFNNNEAVLLVNNQMREMYQLAAAQVAVDQLLEPGALARIDAGTDADSFIRTFGRRAFRRPLTEAEVAEYTNLYNIGAGLVGDQSEFEKGANLVIEGMLQSPHFLYRSELQPDGGPLSGFEVISKLSFWLLGTAPNDALLDRAAAGDFDSVDGVAAVVDEMFADPRSTETIVDLFSQLFSFNKYMGVVKEDPMWTPELNAELREVSELFFEHIYSNDLGLDEILTSTQGFVGPLLAAFYGVNPPPATPTLTDLGPERPGYFSQVPYQMVMGNGSRSDAIHRGVFLNFEVMCAELPVPPPDIPPTPEPDPNQTDRQAIDAHTGIGTCGEGCHGGYINPIGFAFENFDGLGRLRDTDNGQEVNTYSAYPFGTGEEAMVPFTGAPELMPLIAASERAHACLAKNMMSYVLSRDIVIEDESLIGHLMEVSRSDAGSIKEVLREIVISPAFLSRPGAI